MDLAYLPALPKEEFLHRRQKVLSQMQNNSALLLFSEKEKRRNNDCYYPFRQDSNFWYLTGFNEPDSALLLIKTDQEQHSILFLRPKNTLLEIWNGKRLGIEEAPNKLEVDQAYSIDDFSTLFPEITRKLTALYHVHTIHLWGDDLLKKSALRFNQILDWRPILSEMRLIKSHHEIRLLQQAAQISAFGHIKAMQEVRPNRFEYEIESEILYEFNRFGARFPAYNSIIAGGENACILHYTENDQPLKEGELVLIDAGAEFATYAGDITRTFPVSGKFSQAQKAIYQLVLDVQKYAIENLVIGSSIKKVNDQVIRKKVEGLLKLGILQGNIDKIIEEKAYCQFYMHGLGHWLGLDVHDVGNYGTDRDRILEAGMVLTVEPGIYISPNANVPAQYKGIGVRIEDNILITDYGNKILTAAAPKEIQDIEELMLNAKKN
ncbi:Xaa-Pro aminopeptidase [Rodentibacter caecimuris]|uniref:Xaa-Pro aminopeptidase n=1 Tax=Rodentibacter caecimuris TaxID=1796644 RepID=A0ABX3KZG7_9PAST|nr:Xaa-Pro aminopeptidase [Rodentibacter heylii]